MTIYNILDGFHYSYLLDNWEYYFDIPTSEHTVIDITIEDYGKLFPLVPTTIYDFGNESYLAYWEDPIIDIELLSSEEVAARNITIIPIGEEKYSEIFGKRPERLNVEIEDYTPYIIN